MEVVEARFLGRSDLGPSADKVYVGSQFPPPSSSSIVAKENVWWFAREVKV